MTNLPLPSPANSSAGQLMTNAWFMTNVVQPLQFLTNPPLFLANQTSISNGYLSTSWGQISMNNIVIDTYGGAAGSGYAAQVSGYYQIDYGLAVQSSTNTFNFGIAVNWTSGPPTIVGSEMLGANIVGGGTFWSMNGSTMTYLNAGDVVRLIAVTSTSSTVKTATGGGFAPYLQLIWVHA